MPQTSSIAIWDLIVAGIILFSVIRGMMKGFVWQLATIAAIVLCFFFANSLSIMLAPLIGLQEPLNRWVAMFFLYIVFSFISFALARALKGYIEEAKFTEYDKHMGAVLGLVKGVALALVLTFFSVTLSEQARAQVMHTYSGRYAAIIMDRLHPVMPEELHAILEPYIHQLDQDNLDLQHNHDQGEQRADANQPDAGSHDSTNPPAPQPAGDTTRLEELVGQLPGMHDPELRRLAVNALINTAPEDRAKLIDLLGTGVPGLSRIIAIEWQHGKPAESERDQQLRDKLLREISGFFFDSTGAQNSFQEDIELDLAGLPLRIETAVLEDWHADLMGSDPDPDPTTDFRTQLNKRILNQLRYANVPLDTLDTALQNRLNHAPFE